MKTIILAGGKGTRIEPYSIVIPKPLAPIGERPILDIIIHQLAHHGLKDIVLTTGYLSELTKAYVDSRKQDFKDVNIEYVREEEPTGTAGSLRLVPDLNETFLVMNGDLLTTLNYNELIDYHKQHGGILTIAMHKKRIKIDLGVMEADSDNQLISYLEKPEKTYSVSMGIYVYEPKALEYIQQGDTYLDFPHLVQRLLENKEKVVVYPSEDFWFDLGNHEDFSKAQKEFENLRNKLLPVTINS